MISRQALLGASRRAAARTPGQSLRNGLQRRWASEGPQFEGAADNAFNRERAAVKAHAAATSGMPQLWGSMAG